MMNPMRALPQSDPRAVPHPAPWSRQVLHDLSDVGLKPTVVYHNLTPAELYEKVGGVPENLLRTWGRIFFILGARAFFLLWRWERRPPCGPCVRIMSGAGGGVPGKEQGTLPTLIAEEDTTLHHWGSCAEAAGPAGSALPSLAPSSPSRRRCSTTPAPTSSPLARWPPCRAPRPAARPSEPGHHISPRNSTWHGFVPHAALQYLCSSVYVCMHVPAHARAVRSSAQAQARGYLLPYLPKSPGSAGASTWRLRLRIFHTHFHTPPLACCPRRDKRVVREAESEKDIWWGEGSPNFEMDER